MRIGTTSMVFWQTGLAEGLEKIARIGFDAVEVWVSHFLKETFLTREKLAQWIRDAGLACTVHAPIRDINIASVNEGIRRESAKQQIEAVELCAALEGELVVVHPGRRSSGRSDLEQHWRHQADSFVEILEAARRSNVTVTVENMEWEKEDELVRTVADIERLRAMVGEPHLPVTLDLTHFADTARCLDAIEKLGEDIVHVHVSDFTTRRHAPLGDGSLDLETMLPRLRDQGFDGILSLEVFIPGSEVALREQREKLLALV